MAEASSTTTEGICDYEVLVIQAAGIVAGSQYTIGIQRAMDLVGLKFEDARSKMKFYQQVRRKSEKLSVVEKGKATPLITVAAGEQHESVSTLTASAGTSNSTEEESASPATSVRRRLQLGDQEDTEESIEDTSGEAPITAIETKQKRRTRRTPKDVQRLNAKLAAEKARNKAAMKSATLQVQKSKSLKKSDPNKKSIRQIVKDTNVVFNSNLSHKTVARYVLNGMAGQSPMKHGPIGDFAKSVRSALKGAFVTFLKLEQAESKKQSTVRQLSILVNACVNRAGFAKTGEVLTRKLQRDSADQFEVRKANVMEQRRVQWTTQYNLDIWFSTFKDLLIELGFGRQSTDDDGVEGEIFFYNNQLQRILNFDETDGSIDDTNGQRGGRPPVVFIAGDICGGATAVNKSGYSSTIICGSNAAGEPIPPHFQLKSVAEDSNMRLSVEWFAGNKDTVVQFGHPQ